MPVIESVKKSVSDRIILNEWIVIFLILKFQMFSLINNSGYHPIQTAIAATGGTQCGYCSPGMVMQLHSYLQEHPSATQKEIDNILDGNICRCTGYRPILDAIKQFASDSPSKLDTIIQDIEDIKLCKRTGEKCQETCQKASKCHTRTSNIWHHPKTLDELRLILSGFTDETKYRLVGGNTGTGVFKREEESYDALIDVNNIAELKVEATNPMWLGGNVSITDAAQFFAGAASTEPIWGEISHHFQLIANVGVRNQGTLAGNLMMKHAHPDFPSDVYICLVTVGATLMICDISNVTSSCSLEEFLSTNMHKKFIKEIQFSLTKMPKSISVSNQKPSIIWYLPRRAEVQQDSLKLFMKTFKVMPRSTNAHAYVNGGFLAFVDVANNFKISGKPTIVFGGVAPDFIHATQTENFLYERNMNDQTAFQQALQILESELMPNDDPVLAAPEYRKKLALSLFYKVFQNDKLLLSLTLFFSFSCMFLEPLHPQQFRVELIV